MRISSRSAFLLCTCAFLSNTKLTCVAGERGNSTSRQEDGNNDTSIELTIDNKEITQASMGATPFTSATNDPLAGDSSTHASTCSNDKSFRIIRNNGLPPEWCKWLEYRKKGARNRWCNKWNNGRLVKEACALSCGECSIDTPVQPPVQPPTSSKRGLIIGQRERERNVNHFKDSVSWFYNYSQWPSDWEGQWADANGIEFVPMIHKKYLVNRDLSPWCAFDSSAPKLPTCTKQDAINTIRNSINARSNGVAPRYLMGFNEMYNNPPPIDLTPAEAALFWGKYVQPAAVANGLILVSPTTSHRGKGVEWFADFLKECYDRRWQTDPCDVELIKRFAVHEYYCYSDVFEEQYGGEESGLVKGLAQQLGNYGGKNWLNYLRNRDLWVTETNCFWESQTPHLDSKEQCLRTTGQKWQTHGSGHLSKMNKMANVERYAWWTIWNKQTKPNFLTYFNGQLTPIGKAYLNPGKPGVDCEFPGVKLYAGDATLTGTAELFTCKSTGTQMIRRGGSYKEQPGTVTFAVYVPSWGDYAINVSYLSENDRDLSVSVNNGTPDHPTLRKTGSFCFDGGASTVVPLELKGLNAGMNTITFGKEMVDQMPFIEWISVVI